MRLATIDSSQNTISVSNDILDFCKCNRNYIFKASVILVGAM